MTDFVSGYHPPREKILQFGAGNFLRAFVDLFVSQSGSKNPETAGKIVVVQSTGRQRAEAINTAKGRYNVVIQGFMDGRIINEVESVESISRALFAGTQWKEVLEVAVSDQLEWIVSNTTEAGFGLNDRDAVPPSPGIAPHSFPAKLLDVLLARFSACQSAPFVVPCELIEHNGSRLRDLVLAQAHLWNVSGSCIAWITDSVRWIDNLVDRIVPGPPLKHPLADRDPLLVSAEPAAFWGLQIVVPEQCFLDHPAISLAADLTPYYLRKVRILNGAHSALVAHAAPLGLKTVRECVEHSEIGPWIEQVLFEEIVPCVEDRVPDALVFAKTTLERFRNPFLEHQLSSIALNHDAKVRVRLLPTIEDYRKRKGSPPRLLSKALGLS